MKKRSKVTTTYIADIHNHTLPGVDDGSQSMEETIRMLQIASAEGITHMVATPHYKAGRRSADRETVRRLVKEVEKAANDSGIDIKLYPGCEVYYHSELASRFEAGRICTMNNSQYVLVEFSPLDQYLYIRNGLDDLFGMGYRPILAHVERYECMMKDPEHVRSLSGLGVGIQVNASSITGAAGGKVKKFVRRILDEGLVDYVGTDAHSTGSRKPAISKCVDILYKRYESEYADAILYGNAEKNFLKNKH